MILITQDRRALHLVVRHSLRHNMGLVQKIIMPEVAIKPDETFMEYTKRMHKRIQERNRELAISRFN